MANTTFGQYDPASLAGLAAQVEDRERRLREERAKTERENVKIEGIDRIMLPTPNGVLHKLANGWLLTEITYSGNMPKHYFFASLVDLGNHFIRTAAQEALEREESKAMTQPDKMYKAGTP